MIITRRRLFSLIAAPAVIRVAELMPVKLILPPGKKLQVDDIEWTSGPPLQHFVLYDDQKDHLVASWDFGNAFTVVSGESFTLDFGPTRLVVT